MLDEAVLTPADPARGNGTLLCALPHPVRMT